MVLHWNGLWQKAVQVPAHNVMNPKLLEETPEKRFQLVQLESILPQILPTSDLKTRVGLS